LRRLADRLRNRLLNDFFRQLLRFGFFLRLFLQRLFDLEHNRFNLNGFFYVFLDDFRLVRLWHRLCLPTTCG